MLGHAPLMNDSFKMFLIALVTAVATQLLLAPYIMRLHGFTPDGQGAPGAAQPADAANASAGAAPARPSLTAPNLEGMSVNAARERWRAKGIQIIEDGEREDTGAAPGTIVQQRPPPGETLASREIRVTVAKAAETVAVPNVVGMSLEEARGAVRAAGFELSEPTEEEREDIPPGQVLAQQPGADEEVTSGSIVRLTVAKAKTVEVPEVTGSYLSKARKLIEESGLTVGKVRRVEHPERGQGYVLKQDPEPGTDVALGTPIDLTAVAPN